MTAAAARVLLVDNYDSFTYNLAHLVQQAGVGVDVVRNDARTLSELREANHTHWLMSPGPGKPANAGVCVELAKSDDPRPMLGVCLGMQAMFEAEGGEIANCAQVVHGKTSLVSHNDSALLAGCGNPFNATRYHSLKCDPQTAPENLRVTASLVDDDEDIIMAFEHRLYPRFGVQFHPESIASEHGAQIIANFLEVS